MNQSSALIVDNLSIPVLSDYLFKLLLIGDSGVGKSCLLLRFAVSPPEAGSRAYKNPEPSSGAEINSDS